MDDGDIIVLFTKDTRGQNHIV